MDDRIKLRVQQMFGVTGAQLIAVLVSSALILLGIFAFIFVGISAFRGAGSFMAIVNSVVVAFSGFAVNSKGKKDGGPQSTEVLKLLPQVRWCDSVNQLPHPPIFARLWSGAVCSLLPIVHTPRHAHTRQAAMKFAGRALDSIQGSPDDVSELVDATVRAVQADKEAASQLQVARAGTRRGPGGR